MAANGAELFEQIVNIPSVEDPMWNLMKIGQTIWGKKMFKYYTVLYPHLAQAQGQPHPHRPGA